MSAIIYMTKERRIIKRAMALAMVLVLVVLGSLPAFAAGAFTVKSGGVEVRLLKWRVSASAGKPSIYLELRGINNIDHKVWVDLKKVKVDGVTVISTTRSIAPHTDTGDDNPLLFSVWGSDIDGGAGAEAIRTGKMLEMVVQVQDDTTHEKLISESVSVDLTADNNGQPGSAPAPSSSSSASRAPAYTPASSSYKTLKQGSRGQAVRDLQQRLTDLGYLNDRVDGAFDQNTATAVMSFCTQNGLDVQGEATPEMQQLLYSSRAQYYVEPWIPLIIGPRCKWKNPRYASLDNGTLYVQVVNRSASRSIRGYELYYYKTDVWGNRYVEPNTGVALTQRSTMQQTVQPGHLIYSPPITILPFSWTYTVWVGIHKVVFDDGEVREIDPDDIAYFSCTIKK